MKTDGFAQHAAPCRRSIVKLANRSLARVAQQNVPPFLERENRRVAQERPPLADIDGRAKGCLMSLSDAPVACRYVVPPWECRRTQAGRSSELPAACQTGCAMCLKTVLFHLRFYGNPQTHMPTSPNLFVTCCAHRSSIIRPPNHPARIRPTERGTLWASLPIRLQL